MKVSKEDLRLMVEEALAEVTYTGGGRSVEPVSPELRRKAAQAASAEKETERTSPANFAKRIQDLEDKISALEKHQLSWQDVEQMIAQKLKEKEGASSPAWPIGPGAEENYQIKNMPKKAKPPSNV